MGDLLGETNEDGATVFISLLKIRHAEEHSWRGHNRLVVVLIWECELRALVRIQGLGISSHYLDRLIHYQVLVYFLLTPPQSRCVS